MKKNYNRLTTSDMPLDSSFTPTVEVSKPKSAAKPKINAIGKNTTNKPKSSTSKSTKISSSKTATNKTGSKSAQPSKIKTKLVQSADEINDLEKINEENIKTYRFRSKRSKVVIVLLSVLLAIAIATIAIYFGIIKMDANCHLYVHGADATFYVNGEDLTKFRTPSNLQGNSTLTLDIKLAINEAGQFKIKFTPKCYQKNVLMSNTLAYIHGDLFYDGGDGYYYSKDVVEGNQTIDICKGVILDYYYKDSLSSSNFRLDFHVYLERV